MEANRNIARSISLCGIRMAAPRAFACHSFQSSFDFKSLMPTLAGVERPQDVESRVVFGHTVRNSDPDNCLTWARQWGRDPGVWNVMLPSGKYVLCVSVGDRKGTPTIALPLKNGRPDRRYPLGMITVSDSHSTKKKGTLQ